MAITKEFADSIVITIANYLKIPPCEITFLAMEDEYNNIPGFFVEDLYIININTNVVSTYSDLEFTSFLIHEMRHAYQYVQVKENRSDEPKELLRNWKGELKKYKNPLLNFKDYLTQSIEVDAVAFTAFFTKKYFKQNLLIPEVIKERVLKRIEEFQKKYI